jgi:hypothetical protein
VRSAKVSHLLRVSFASELQSQGLVRFMGLRILSVARKLRTRAISIRSVAYATGSEQVATEYFGEMLQHTIHVTSSQDSLDKGVVVESGSLAVGYLNSQNS